MKHEKEWYTCDRCGAEIKEIPTRAIWKNIFSKQECKPEELRVISVEKSGYITDEKFIDQDVVSLSIVECYNMKDREIHLCGKCRKAFERFLGNEN